MESHKESNPQPKQRPETVVLKRNEMKTLQELAFGVLIHRLRNICTRLKMTNLSNLSRKLKSLSFKKHNSCWTLPLFEELALFAYDTLDYRLTQSILNNVVKLFESFKTDTTTENIKSKLLNVVKGNLILATPESSVMQDKKVTREKMQVNYKRIINVDEIVKYLQSLLQELLRVNAGSPEYDSNMPCLEYHKISFQFLGVRKLCDFIRAYIDRITKGETHLNLREFSALERAYECIPQILCDIINDFLDAGLHKTKNEYICNAVKQALNEKMTQRIHTEVLHIISEVVSTNIPFATKKRLAGLLNPDICTDLTVRNLGLASFVKIQDFKHLEVLSIPDTYFDDVHDIQYLKCLKRLKITATHCRLSDSLSYLKYPIQLEVFILKGLVENENVLTNLFHYTPHLKQLNVSLKLPGGYVYIGRDLEELEELKIEHIDLYPKYRILFAYLRGRMKKLTCNCVRSQWLIHLSYQATHSISEVCFKEFICDSHLSKELCGLRTVSLSETVLTHDLFIHVGEHLTSLTFIYCSYVNLGCIADHCPNLLNLKLEMCDFEGYDHLRSPQFPHLKTAYICPVFEEDFCGWCLLACSVNIEEIVALRSTNKNKCFDNFIDVNPLSQLKKFETRIAHHSWLTTTQAQKIVDKCNSFRIVRCTEIKEQAHPRKYGFIEKMKQGVYVSTTT